MFGFFVSLRGIRNLWDDRAIDDAPMLKDSFW